MIFLSSIFFTCFLCSFRRPSDPLLPPPSPSLGSLVRMHRVKKVFAAEAVRARFVCVRGASLPRCRCLVCTNAHRSSRSVLGAAEPSSHWTTVASSARLGQSSRLKHDRLSHCCRPAAVHLHTTSPECARPGHHNTLPCNTAVPNVVPKMMVDCRSIVD
jgi:hypothetical protein